MPSLFQHPCAHCGEEVEVDGDLIVVGSTWQVLCEACEAAYLQAKEEAERAQRAGKLVLWHNHRPVILPSLKDRLEMRAEPKTE